MTKYEKFTTANPTTKEQALLAGKGVLFLKDPQGNCWYDVADEATAKKLIVVLINDNNVVCGITKEPRAAFPNGFSVVLVDKVPQAMTNDGLWSYVNGAFTYSKEKVIDIANDRKTRALLDCASLLQLYQGKLAVEALNPQALKAVQLLETYRDALLMVDVNKAPGIDWPKTPII